MMWLMYLLIRFQEHVKKHLPSEVVGVDEFLSLRRSVLTELNRSDIETPDEAPPGVEAAPGDEQVGTNVVRSFHIDSFLCILYCIYIYSIEKLDLAYCFTKSKYIQC